MSTAEETRDMEHRHIKLSYNKIDDLIYAGNNMCCQGHFEEELLSKGITVDISLEAERLDNPQGVKYFFWFPWKEDTAPSLELINIALKVIDSLLEQHIKMYIHCKNGHGRTTTFLAAYFLKKLGKTTDEALGLVKERRPSAHLNEIQLRFLREYERSLKQSKI